MSSTTTDLQQLKLNRGAIDKLEENLSEIGTNELILVTDKTIPIPTEEDSGKVLGVDSNGDYELKTPTTVVVDQTYGSTSANAQSGVAVAQAISGISTGTKLYSHYLYDSNNGRTFTFITTSSTAFTYNSDNYYNYSGHIVGAYYRDMQNIITLSCGWTSGSMHNTGILEAISYISYPATTIVWLTITASLTDTVTEL